MWGWFAMLEQPFFSVGRPLCREYFWSLNSPSEMVLVCSLLTKIGPCSVLSSRVWMHEGASLFSGVSRFVEDSLIVGLVCLAVPRGSFERRFVVNSGAWT